MSFTVRQLRDGDVVAVRDMLDLMGRAFEAEDDYSGAQPDDDYLAALLADSSFVGVVAETDGRVIGGLFAYVLPKPEQARSEMYIYDLAVDEQNRREGVATGLINALKPIARARGAWVIYVQADHDDPAAIALYEKLGTREEVLHFDIGVGLGSAG